MVRATSVDVFANGDFIGTIALDDSGSGALNLDTDNGDDVPTLQDGDDIEQRAAPEIEQIKDDVTDWLALAGLFDAGWVRQVVAFQDRAQVR